MDVQGSAEHFQYVGGNNQAVGGDNGGVGPRSAKPGAYVGAPKIGWLPKIQPARQGKTFDWTGFQAQASTRRAIRLGQHQHNLVACPNERAERPFGEIRCAGED